jgi:ABC-type uncharacterized transport system substrate-binding protein
MRRRDFIKVIGSGAVAWPLVASAQQQSRMRRLGILMSSAESDTEYQNFVRKFVRDLQELGWTEGPKLRIDYRWAAADPERIRMFAKELVDMQPDLILSQNTPTTEALLQRTRTIPIVFCVVSDPVGSGFVASMAHPGGNATGFINFEPSMSTKWLDLLKQIMPRLDRVGLMFNPDTTPYQYYWRPFQSAAAEFSVQPIQVAVRDPADIEQAFVALARDPPAGLVLTPDVFNLVHRQLIISLSARHRVPTLYFYRYLAAAGGLISYGIDVGDLFRQAAPYVDRILKGEKSSELPIQTPTRYELVINLKTAKTLGVTIPDKLLAIADEVIE